MDFVRVQLAWFHQLFDLGDGDAAGHRGQWVEVRRGLAEDEVAVVVAAPGPYEGEVGGDAVLQDVPAAGELPGLLGRGGVGDGRPHVLEHGITTDFALVRAWRGDRHGNLVFRRASANFNPLAAMAGRITLAEVEELVEPGALDPDQVHLPGVFVQRVVPLTPAQAADKQIEKRTVRA